MRRGIYPYNLEEKAHCLSQNNNEFRCMNLIYHKIIDFVYKILHSTYQNRYRENSSRKIHLIILSILVSTFIIYVCIHSRLKKVQTRPREWIRTDKQQRESNCKREREKMSTMPKEFFLHLQYPQVLPLKRKYRVSHTASESFRKHLMIRYSDIQRL